MSREIISHGTGAAFVIPELEVSEYHRVLCMRLRHVVQRIVKLRPIGAMQLIHYPMAPVDSREIPALFDFIRTTV